MSESKQIIPGFYYHYKHDPNGSVGNYTYEVLGVGHHTEEENVFFVVYRPLYPEALVYRLGKLFYIRPRDMFLESVVKDGVIKQRFTQIVDTAIITDLILIRARMYVL